MQTFRERERASQGENAPLPPQLYVGKRRPDPARFIPPTSDLDRSFEKPMGGLWTSTFLHPLIGSPWTLHCRLNDIFLPAHGHWPAWLVLPRSDARIYDVTDLRSGIAFYARYGCDLLNRDGLPMRLRLFRPLDWESVRADYDAVHLSAAAAAYFRFPFSAVLDPTDGLDTCGTSFSTWDVESTVWLHPAWESVRGLGYRSFTPHPSDVAPP